MSRTYQKSDFPLKPVDAHGRPLSVGDLAKIIAIPDVGFHGFDDIARARYTAMMDRTLPITEFDESGYAVFALWYKTPDDVLGNVGEPSGVSSFATHDFCFDPRDLELGTPGVVAGRV